MDVEPVITSPEEIQVFSGTTIPERETVLRLDPETDEWVAWTANATIAKEWVRRGWPVQVDGRVGGVPRTWEARGLRRQAVGWRRAQPQAEKSARMKEMWRARKEQADGKRGNGDGTETGA